MKADCCKILRIYFRTAQTLYHPPFKNTTAACISDRDQVQSITVVNSIRLGKHSGCGLGLEIRIGTYQFVV